MRAVTTLALCGAVAAPAMADPRAEGVLRDLTQRGAAAVDFTDAFAGQVGANRVDAILTELRGQIGQIRDIEVDGQSYVLRSEDWLVRGTIALDAEGAIAGLFFEPPERVGLDLAAATDALRAIGGDVAWLVTRDGDTLSARGADRPMPVGSAFKLAVLAELAARMELAARIETGEMGWSDVVTLEDRHRSLPGGDMRLWPTGSPVTLSTAAIAMIAESDNTATDLLMAVLGRDGIAERLGMAFVPTTREVFALAADTEVGEAFGEADADGRAEIAADAARNLPSVADVEDAAAFAWPVALTRLCDLAREVADMPVMRINPGPVPVADWSRIAFKGGSVPGVLNLTAAMTDAAGRTHCVAVTVNDMTASETEAVAAYRGVLAALREGE